MQTRSVIMGGDMPLWLPKGWKKPRVVQKEILYDAISPRECECRQLSTVWSPVMRWMRCAYIERGHTLFIIRANKHRRVMSTEAE